MKRSISIVVGGLSVAVLAAVLVTGVSNAQEVVTRGPFKPVASVHGLMGGQGMVFSQLQKAVTDRSMEHRHATIQVMAEVLAELSNVNQYHASKADYEGWARDVRDAALALSAEAKKGEGANDNAMRKSLRALKTFCGACHDAYQ